MRWPLTVAIALAALPAIVAAQQEQRPQSQTEQPTYNQQGQMGDSLTPQDTSRAATQQVDTTVSAGEVVGGDSIGRVGCDTTTNQSQSGVVNDSGKSTLGPNVKKVKPTHGAAVTSKGDTLRKGGDTTSGAGGGRSSSDSTSSSRGSTQPPR